MVDLVDMLHRHIKNTAGFGVNGQETGIGLLAFLAQRGQHDLHDRLVPFRRAAKDIIKPARAIEVGRRIELVLKTERIQEPAQHGVVMIAETVVLAERIGHARQGPLLVFLQHVLLRHVLGHLAHPVQIVRKTDQPRRNVADDLERPADHRGAAHLAKGADMGQTRRAIAGLEQNIALFRRRLFIAFQQTTRFLERPGFRIHRCVAQRGHGVYIRQRSALLVPQGLSPIERTVRGQ